MNQAPPKNSRPFPRHRLPIAALLLTSGVLSAQGKDIIELTDGTILRGVKVESWNAKEIKFKARAGEDSRPAHMVRTARVERVREVLNLAGNDPAVLIQSARDSSDPLIASACLHKAAMLFYEAGKPTDMLTALQTIDEKYPESPYAPDYYRWKIRYYIGKQKPSFGDAAKIAVKYGDASRTRTWSEAYQHDSEYWERRIEAASGKVQPATYVSNLQDIIGKTSGISPFVTNAAMVDLADAYREMKKYEEANAEYNKLQERKDLDDDVRARMYLGLGFINLENAVNSSKKQYYHDALENFLKVYLNARDADPELVGEALYQAAKACEQWGELDTCAVMAARLRGRLKLRKPYSETKAAKKK